MSYPYFHAGVDKSDKITDIMFDEKGRLALTYFAMKEFGAENVLCLVCTWQYAYRPSVQRMRAIYETFLVKNSPFEVNVKEQTRDDIRVNYYNRRIIRPVNSTSLDDARLIFKGLNAELQFNVSDTLSRFTPSPLYKRLQNNKRWKKKQAEFVTNATANVLITGGTSLVLGPAVAPFLGTFIGAKPTMDVIKGKMDHTKEKATYDKDDTVNEFRWFMSGPFWSSPRLPWDEYKVQGMGVTQILDNLNRAGFDLTVVGYPKQKPGLGE